MRRVCAITGAHGLVGSACARYLHNRGFKVLELVRKPDAEVQHCFDLAEDFNSEILEGVCALVHCAYDFRPIKWADINRTNVVGSIRLLKAASSAGVGKIINVSSVSAFKGCESLYGQAKLEVEGVAEQIGALSIRPGLVVGDPERGMFGSLNRMTDLPMLPVFNGGHQPMVSVHVDDLARLVGQMIELDVANAPVRVIAAHSRSIAFRDMLLQIAANRGRQIKLVSVPGGLVLRGMRLLETLGIPVPFRSDSLVSLLNPDPHMDLSQAGLWGVQFREFGQVDDRDVR